MCPISLPLNTTSAVIPYLSPRGFSHTCERKETHLVTPCFAFLLFFPGLLKAVSLAVDLIMAHFGTSRDHEEKVDSE